ncbi:hypothetical protein DL770_006612 [Monosporascus sp. CRB-9-2]|nr:hypothetical protein DL770_006612 [Monosporascus sp. CRB-9-2]
MSNCSYDCSSHPSEVEPYGDISGPGVLAGFVGTAFIAVALIISYYLFAYDPKLNPFEACPVQHMASHSTGASQAAISRIAQAAPRNWRTNPIDEMVLKWIRGVRYFPYPYGERQALRPALEKCLLSMCDIQILTGPGILVSGQHFCQHPRELTWRLIAMFTLLAMLLAALVPTGFFDWADDITSAHKATKPSFYATCFYVPATDTLLETTENNLLREPLQGKCTAVGLGKTELLLKDLNDDKRGRNNEANLKWC